MKTQFKLLCLALCIVLCISMLTACGSKDTGAGAPEGNGDGNGSVSEPAKKDTLVIAMTGNPTSFDPAGKNDGASMAVKRQMFEGLTIIDTDMNVSPCLAESWEYEDDNTIIFHLRQGVKFHDGSELTAEDVAHSLKRAYDGSYATAYMAAFDFEKSGAIDKYTYKLVTKYPSGTILNVLAYPGLGITSKAAVEALGDRTVTDCPGTGPYKYVNWVQGDSVELTKFEDYWGTSEGCKNILFRIIPETASRVIEVETVGVDLAYDVTAQDVKRYEGDDSIKSYRKTTTTMIYLGMNCSKPPFDNEKVRQAVAHCVKRQDLVDMVFSGQGSAATSSVCSCLYGYSDKVKVLEHNPDKARALLAEAGYPDGLKTNIWVRDQQLYMDAAEVVANQLADGGITAEVKVIEWASLLTTLEARGLDLYIMSLGVATGDAGDGLFRYFYSQNPFSSNTAFFKDAGFDELITAANQELDTNRRLELLEQAQQYAIDKAPWAPLIELESLFLSNSRVHNLVLDPTTYQYFKDVYVTE
jgi:peptide/nickel transport system substrate-binding protein